MPTGSASGALAAALAVPVAGTIYLILTWGQRSTGECSWRDDDQIGLKVIVGTLIMVGTALFAVGLQSFLHLLMTFSDFIPRLKAAFPDLLVGAIVVGGTVMFAVPKTNHEQHPKALRLTAGAIALFAAVATVINLDDLFKTVFIWPDWSAVAGAVTSLVTSVAIFGGSGYLYARMIGVEVPELPMPNAQPQASAQPAQGGYQQPAPGGYQPPAQAQPGPQGGPPPAPGGYQQPGPGGYQPPQQGGGGYPPPGGGPYGQ